MMENPNVQLEDRIDEIRALLVGSASRIKVIGFADNGKATEKYVVVEFLYPSTGQMWEGRIPYQYRRAAIHIETPVELAHFLELVYDVCEQERSQEWVAQQVDLWNTEYAGQVETKPIFLALTDLRWNCNTCASKGNPNAQSRIRAIKQLGYVLGTDTRRHCIVCGKRKTHSILIPLTVEVGVDYEAISPALRRRIIRVLGRLEVYELRKMGDKELLPDHKFPEVRWDTETAQANLDSMTDSDIRSKFQLLDNRRNLQKKEVCRSCYETGIRGQIYGIGYYYSGTEQWPLSIRRGKAAEKGCIGCPWYDIQAWRDSLNAQLDAITRQ